MIRLLVGLGNPGPQYEATRHNAGFWFVDEVARKYEKPLTPERGYSGLAARVDGPFGALWLLEPMTFMNLSGKSVAALARFFKIAPEEVLVAHDELDLLPGQVRLKQGGSHAGHNGLRDIVAQLGSANFHRVRLGIGHPGVKAEVADYVLRKPKPEERDAIQDAIGETLASLDLILAGEMERAMMKVHARPVPTGKALRTRPAGIASASVDPTPTAMSSGRVASEASSQDAGRHGARRSSSQSSGSTPSASPTPGLTSSGPSASAPSLSSSAPASSDPISSRPMSSPTIPPSPTLSSDASAGAPPSQGNVVEGTS